MKKTTLAIAVLTLMGCVQQGSVIPDPDYKKASDDNYLLGNGYAQNGMYDVALEKLNKSVEQNPQNADAYTAMGYIYSKTGRDKEAYVSYNKAMIISPNNSSIANSFGVFLCGENRYKEAYPYFNIASSDLKYKNPEIPLTNAGLCARQGKDYQLSKQYLDKALSINSTYKDAMVQMVLTNYEMQDYIQSLFYVEKLIKNKWIDDDLLWIASKSAIELNDPALSKRYSALLFELFPQSKWAEQAQFILRQ